MARVPRRYIIENQSFFHVTWKCHNNEFLLKDEKIKAHLYWLLKKYKKECRIKIYGYCFMDNHPHIVGYCESLTDFSKFFQIVNGLLARFINKNYERRGQVVMDRFKSPQIQDERHMLHTLHYIDLNPLRAGICRRAKDYKWSSYRHHATGKADELLDPLPLSTQFSPSDYQQQNKIILQRDSKTILPLRMTYFIGTADWIRKRKQQMIVSLSGSPPKNYKAQG